MGLVIELVHAEHDIGARVQASLDDLTSELSLSACVLGRTTPNLTEYQVGYEALHWLRGFAAELEERGAAPPPGHSRTKKPYEAYPALGRIYQGEVRTQRFVHLIEHHDASGIYVPVALDEPLWCPPDGGLSVGSSVKLLDELEQLKAPLGIADSALRRLEQAEALGDCEVLNDPIEGWPGCEEVLTEPLGFHPYEDEFVNERSMWLVLHWLARQSCERSLVICFR